MSQSNMDWRRTHRAAYERAKARYYERSRLEAWSGRAPWTVEACERVLAHTVPDRVLAEELGRSIEAIQIMRVKLKKRGRDATRMLDGPVGGGAGGE